MYIGINSYVSNTSLYCTMQISQSIGSFFYHFVRDSVAVMIVDYLVA